MELGIRHIVETLRCIITDKSRSWPFDGTAGEDKMSNHPINLAVRFLLELTGLFAMGYWGWTQHSGPLRFIWAIGFPLIAAVLWGTFRVPGDPGKAPVAVPGIVRLMLKLVYFSAGIWAFHAAGREAWALVFGTVTLIHYLISYDRILWLVRSPQQT